MRIILKTLPICLLLVALTTSVFGQMTYEATGGNALIPEVTSTVDLPDGNTLVRLSSQGFSWVNDEAAVGGNGSINCEGSNTMSSEGEPLDGAGTCEILDVDGDLWWIWWTGATTGDWGLTGGTGKYAGITGAGTWTNQVTYPDGRYMNDWTGAWTIPAHEME